MKKIVGIIVALATVCSLNSCGNKGEIRHIKPSKAGVCADSLAKCDSLIEAAVYNLAMPGAVLCVMKDGAIVYEKAYGYRAVYPKKEKMTEDTIFDLASLSKCVGTTLSFMQLVEQGKVNLDDPVDKYIEGFQPWVYDHKKVHKEVMPTVRHLMTHASGIHQYPFVETLVDSVGLYCPADLRHQIAADLPRHFEPGKGFRYSCANFITLQYILEDITGQRLCDYAETNVFKPLGLKDTRYYPVDKGLSRKTLKRIAPTEIQPGWGVLRGQVHDPAARKLNGGNSGNAGVFSTAEDLAVIAQMILNGGEFGGTRILQRETVDMMCAVQDSTYGRTLGWDSFSPYAGLLGTTLREDHCICHTGYTGTSMVIDLDRNLTIILLTNRAHPSDGGGVGTLRAQLSDILAGAFN